MKRTDTRAARPIDLGRASVETKGQPGNQLEFGVIARPLGLTDD